jgi:hypothetical protein
VLQIRTLEQYSVACYVTSDNSPYLSLAALSSTRGVEVSTLKPIDLMTAIYAAANHTTIAGANFVLNTERSHISISSPLPGDMLGLTPVGIRPTECVSMGSLIHPVGARGRSSICTVAVVPATRITPTGTRSI